ncbi:hypothetical protein HanIR_Chr11g0559491 [Helianthus annuus]|nr:hypothetical protein HanIR_Chr11g0559491 [Helianthus annuus]
MRFLSSINYSNTQLTSSSTFFKKPSLISYHFSFFSRDFEANHSICLIQLFLRIPRLI